MQSNKLPETGFLRINEVLKLIPVSRTTWYENMDKGIYPKPIKLSERSVAWRCEDIRALIKKLGAA